MVNRREWNQLAMFVLLFLSLMLMFLHNDFEQALNYNESE